MKKATKIAPFIRGIFRACRAVLLFSFLSGPGIIEAQSTPGPVDWGRWQFLIGEWHGEGTGKPGQSTGIFTFRKDLDGRILVRSSTTEVGPQQGKPGYRHSDTMIIYPDSTGNPASAIYFDNEGHVIQYSVTFPGKSIVLTSKSIQHTPAFRLTYEPADKATVNVKFEISSQEAPGEFITYLEGISTRVIH
jgi:hypothetical protein